MNLMSASSSPSQRAKNEDGTPKHYTYYFCQNKKCKVYRKNIPQVQIEDGFLNLLRESRLSDDYFELLDAILQEEFNKMKAQQDNQTNSLRNNLNNAKREMDKIINKIISCNDESIIAALEQKHRDAKSSIKDIQSAIHAIERSTYDLSDYQRTFIQLKELRDNSVYIWEQIDQEGKKLMAKLLFNEPIRYKIESGYPTHQFTLFNQQKGIKNNAKKRLVAQACQLLNSIERVIDDGTLALLYSKMGLIG
jgi:hypothetical protein